MGWYKSLPAPCVTHKPYVDNGVFVPLSTKGHFYIKSIKNPLDTDARFDLDRPLCRQCLNECSVGFYPERVMLYCSGCGNVQNLKRQRIKRPYRFIWRDFYSPKVEYDITPSGTSDAFHYRLAFDRGDRLLMQQQRDLYNTSPTFHRILTSLRSRLSIDLRDDPLESCIQYALDSQHPKYKLRLRTLFETMSAGKWNTFNKCLMDTVTAKEKREWAKFGKFMRLVCDLTCAGSLVGGHMASVIKKSIERTEVGQQWEFMRSPSFPSMQLAFEELCTTQTLKFLFHSDDSCTGIRCSDGHFYANMDIKSADASAGPAVFDALRFITLDTPFCDTMDASIKQCKKPLALSNPYYNYRTLLRPRRPVLYSGSVLTTNVNNIGNLLIYSSIKDWLDTLNRLPTKSECELMLPKLAEKAGYQITVEVCSTPEDLQFLKYSPGRNFSPFLNLGVMLRAIGSSDGDLPGRLSTASCDKRDAEIVAGFVHAGDHFLSRALRKRFPNGKCPFYKNYMLAHVEHGGLSRDVGDHHVMTRYNLSVSECQELLYYIDSMGVGSSVDCSATRKILSKDYGYSY